MRKFPRQSECAEHRRQKAGAKRECRNSEIQRKVKRQRSYLTRIESDAVSWRHPVHQDRQAGVRNQKAGASPNDDQEQSLHQKLAEDSPPARAQREANSRFTLARGGAGQQQPSDIGKR